MLISRLTRLTTLLAVVVASCLTASRLSHAQISWVNRNGGFFESGVNWSAGRAPHSDEQIFLGQPGNYSIDLLAGHTVAGLIVTGQARPTLGSPQPFDRTLVVEGNIDIHLGGGLTLGGADLEGTLIVDSSGHDVVLNGFAADEQAGRLELTGGSLLTSRAGVVGQTGDFIGRLTMAGSQTVWNTDELTIGLNGDAVVEIASGARLASNELVNVARHVGTSAIVNVGGVGENGRPSTWANLGSETIISHSGETELNINGGAVVTLSPTGNVEMANGGDSNVAVQISGTDVAGNPSTFTTGNLSVSVFGGRSEFVIENGAQMISRQTQLGKDGMGIVNLVGADANGRSSLWTAESVSLVDGEIEIFDGGRIEVSDQLEVWNLGTLHVYDGIVSANRVNIISSHGLTLTPEATLEFNRYQGDLVNLFGTISPGIASEVSVITGDLQQQPGGTLLLEVDGESGLHDAVGVAGVADFAGSLEINLTGESMPKSSDIFPVLSAASVIGVFENVANGERLDTENGKGSFVVNYGAASSFDADRIVLSDFMPHAEGVVGDFNGDGVLDAIDIDMLSAALNSSNASFDLTADGVVDREDQAMWVSELKNTYFGDANLDGEFNSGDFVQVFQRGEYEDVIPGNSGWADGDWNGDGDFDSSDFVLAFQSGGYELGPRAAMMASSSNVAAVPEPPASSVLPVFLVCFSVVRRRGR